MYRDNREVKIIKIVCGNSNGPQQIYIPFFLNYIKMATYTLMIKAESMRRK